MQKISPISDFELQRQTKNHTDSQKKNANATREGAVVNSFKNEHTVNMSDVYDSLVISENARMPEKIKEDKNIGTKNLMPISLIATGVMGSMALLTALIKKSAKINLNIEQEKQLGHLTRNISITEELVQGLYQIVQTPNRKTILAGTGVLTLTAMAFMGKMFVDGFKDVWVKKKEAHIQKDLQENLINVETQSFSGKIQIIRSMLAQKANEFKEYICATPDVPIAFKNVVGKRQPEFKGKTEQNEEKNSNLKYFALGAATLGSIVGLAYFALKNLGKSKELLEDGIKVMKDNLNNAIDASKEETKAEDKIKIMNMFLGIDENKEFVEKALSKLKWKDNAEVENFTNEVVSNLKTSTIKAPEVMAGSGVPKPSFNSYVSDYRAFFYNYLLEPKNPQFKLLFYGVTGLSALTYGGNAMGEAIKDVQVKKMNAQTELELQKRLVATELRNFKAKKDAAINPLCEEFYAQVEKGKPKEELKTIAENILFEVKNGPPFVYS